MWELFIGLITGVFIGAIIGAVIASIFIDDEIIKEDFLDKK